jgi:hypothetical protein
MTGDLTRASIESLLNEIRIRSTTGWQPNADFRRS